MAPAAAVSCVPQDPLWRDATGGLAPGVFNPERSLSPEAVKSPWQLQFVHGARWGTRQLQQQPNTGHLYVLGWLWLCYGFLW
jgi:triacylglycerol esterase/lipase EstA (alpha/beta hydrolase family)